MRKFIIVLMSFCLLLGVLGFGAVSATYNGENVTELDGTYDGWYEQQFLQSGQFVFPTGVTEAEVLVVAGGGGGGMGWIDLDEDGGPGGAGGLIWIYNTSVYEFNATELNNGYISVTIGLGGAGSSDDDYKGSNGGNSIFGHLIALGGGGGGSRDSPAGADGGCGGGAGQKDCSISAGGIGLQNASSGDSGLYGWGANGGDTNADGSGAGGCAWSISQGGGAYIKAGSYLKTGKSVWGTTYSTGGTGGGGNVGYTNRGTGGDSMPKNSQAAGKAGGSGIVIVRYEVKAAPDFLLPINASTVNALKYYISWEEIADATYDFKWSNASNFTSYNEDSYSNENTILYLENGDWYFDVRYDDGNKSLWYSALNNYWTFTANNKPTFDLPNLEENSPYVDFNWTDIDEVTNYELEVYSDEALTTRVFFEEPSYNYDTLTMDSGDYWARVRGVDDYVNGSWSDTYAFSVDIADIPFSYNSTSVNYYGGDTMQYNFTSLDTNVTYTFKINKINDNGTFNSNIATKTVVGDGDGKGSFTYTFSNSAHYPFEVRYDETNSQLFKHFVAVRPSDRFYQAADHKLNYSDTVLAVGAGDVVYNNKSGFLHTNTLPTQCLYEYGDYFLLHYNFEWQEGVKFKILIMDMETGALVATIHSDDLYAFNHELGYAEKNFIVVPTDGSTPVIVDDYALLLSYEEDDWNSLELPKGAYAYILIEITGEDNPNLAFGESVILVGDSSTAEWTITPSAASIIEGQKITWTITCNTEGIWDSYKLMRFYDTASDQYYLGTAGSPYYQSYPASYAASFTLNYNTNPALGYSAGAIYGIRPENVPTDVYQYEYMTFDLSTTYGYIVTQGYTITEATDLTEGLDDWLVTVGLGTATTKLMLSMAIIILLVIACAALHVPVAGISIVALAAFIAMVAIGFIPIWTTVILGLALIVFMIKLFNGSGGGE